METSMMLRRSLILAATLSAATINACSEEPTRRQPEQDLAAPAGAGWLTLPPAQSHAPELVISRGRGGQLELRRLLADSRRKVALELAETSDGWTRLRDEVTGTQISFQLREQQSGPARLLNDVLDYAPSEDSPVHVALRAYALGVEQYVQLARREAEPQLSYAVALAQVSQLRAGRDVVEFLDARGHARFRTSRPWVRDAQGERRRANVGVTQCVEGSLRADAAQPVLAKPNATDCRVDLTWDDVGLVYPLMLDPPWESTASLQDGRFFHTATVVGDQVVVIGGYGADGAPLLSVEAYDAGEEVWEPWPNLPASRARHTATALSGDRILVVGGYDENNLPLASTLIGSKAAGWGNESDLKFARAEHVAVTVPGILDKVIVVGGGVAEPETFDPNALSPSLVWSAGKPAKVARYGLAAAGLPGRFVLVTGGSTNPFPNEGWLASVESYDSQHDEWYDEKPMSVPRAGHTATALSAERVLVVGGAGGAEVFNEGAWMASENPPPTRQYHSALLLPSDGDEERVIIAGGKLNNLLQPSTAYFVPEANSWQTLPATLAPPRFGHTMSLLSGGRLVIAGGRQGFGTALKDTNGVVALSSGQACDTSAQCLSGSCEDNVCCKTACPGDCAACSKAAGSSTNGSCEPVAAGKICSESKDACYNDGLCDGEGLECAAQTPVDDDTVCDDGDAATSNDSCQAGKCSGASQGAGGESGSSGDAGAPNAGQAGEAAGSGNGGAGSAPQLPAGTNPFSCAFPGKPHGSTPAALLGLVLALLRRRRPRKPRRQS
jgi:MYXO-CTERM domain-containing protein